MSHTSPSLSIGALFWYVLLVLSSDGFFWCSLLVFSSRESDTVYWCTLRGPLTCLQTNQLRSDLEQTKNLIWGPITPNQIKNWYIHLPLSAYWCMFTGIRRLWLLAFRRFSFLASRFSASRLGRTSKTSNPDHHNCVPGTSIDSWNAGRLKTVAWTPLGKLKNSKFQKVSKKKLRKCSEIEIRIGGSKSEHREIR